MGGFARCMSIYEFKSEDAERFVREYGPAKFRGTEYVFERCPYCHGGTKPDRHTFSLNRETGKFQCKRSSCSAHGNMITLARDFNFELSEDVRRYYNIRNYNRRFRTFRDAHRITESKDEAIEYLKSRGLSEEVCRKYEITIKGDDKNIIVFPFKDDTGELKFIKYRNIHPEPGQSKEWCEANCMPILFGMNHCSDGGRLVITEGQFDSLSLTEAGIENAVSVPIGMNGFTWVPHCWNWLQKFSEIVVFGDCENGIISLADTIKTKFPKKTRVVRVEDYHGHKDANDILRVEGKQALVDAVNNAEYTASSRLKDMSEVKSVNIEEQPCISTGFDEMDRILTGGFHYGGVVILTGKRGDGKSTMGSQFVVEALSQNHNCMVYSGELPNDQVKNWLDRQVSGKKSLTEDDSEKCNAWYKGRLCVYDDTDLAEDEDETESLLEIVEEAIIRKNCELILLDNLMTAMEEEAETNEVLFRKQSNFVGKLAKMARRLKIIIILVAHPRKTMTTTLTNDDVSGTGDITNKASLVMIYSRITHNGEEPDPTVRALSVTKNRLTGRLGSIKVYFSEDSKRISDNSLSFEKKYMTEDFSDVDDDYEIPF